MTVDGLATPIYGADGNALYLAATSMDFSSGTPTPVGITFVPLAGQPGGDVYIPPTDYAITADGNHAWVVFPISPEQTIVALFDLENNQGPDGADLH